MNDVQLVTLLAAPITSLVIVLAGYIVQNSNLNARTSELRNEFTARLSTEIGAVRTEIAAVRSELGAFREVMRAELSAIRSEMAKNQSELLTALAQHDHRIMKP